MYPHMYYVRLGQPRGKREGEVEMGRGGDGGEVDGRRGGKMEGLKCQ